MKKRPSEHDHHRPLDRGDARTLALTTPELTEARVEAYLRYQEAFARVVEAELARGRLHHEAVSRAQPEAVKAGALPSKELADIGAAVQAFCGARLAVRTAERKLDRLRAGEKSRDSTPDELERLESERQRLDAMLNLHQRYGEASLSRLSAREGALLTLHERVTRLLSRGG